jgi:hypothetical protein
MAKKKKSAISILNKETGERFRKTIITQPP